MSLSAELASQRDQALTEVSCAQWAGQQGWKLQRSGNELVGPCPKCGGTDRFNINIAKNVWLCRECGVGGDVIFLVQHLEGVTFAAACERITGRKAADPVDPKRAAQMEADRLASQRQQEADAQHYRAKAKADGYAVWKSGRGQPMDLVATYFRQLRGLDGGRIDFDSPDWHAGMPLRLLPERGYWHNGRNIATAPVLLAAVQMPDGHFGAVHQTYLDLSQPKGKLVLPPIDGKELPAKKVLGIKKGGAIRLFTPAEAMRLVMGEGIETTMTPLVHAFEERTAYWAGVDLGNMSGKAARKVSGGMAHDQPDMDDLDCFLPPDWVEELVYLAEGDEPEKHTIEKVTRGLRRAQRVRAMRRADNPALAPLRILMVPPGEGGDDLNAIAMAEAAEIPDGDDVGA